MVSCSATRWRRPVTRSQAGDEPGGGPGLAGKDGPGLTAPDLAVLDLPLRDGDGRRLARVLRASGVPFLVHADDARDATACAELRAAPRLIKPAWHRDLVLVLGQLAREARP